MTDVVIAKVKIHNSVSRLLPFWFWVSTLSSKFHILFAVILMRASDVVNYSFSLMKKKICLGSSCSCVE